MDLDRPRARPVDETRGHPHMLMRDGAAVTQYVMQHARMMDKHYWPIISVYSRIPTCTAVSITAVSITAVLLIQL